MDSRFAEKEHKAQSDAEEVSSTSKNETPVIEPKDEPDEPAPPEDDLITLCDNIGATTINIDEEDIVLLS